MSLNRNEAFLICVGLSAAALLILHRFQARQRSRYFARNPVSHASTRATADKRSPLSPRHQLQPATEPGMSNSSANTTAANILNDNTSDDNTVPSNSSPYNKHCTSKPTTPSNRSLKRLIPADDPVACESRSQFSLLSYNVLSYKYVYFTSSMFPYAAYSTLQVRHGTEREKSMFHF